MCLVQDDFTCLVQEDSTCLGATKLVLYNY